MRVLLMDGVRFLLGTLHVESLRDRTNAKMVKKALETLPKGSDALSFAYDGVMQRLENQREGFRLLAKRLLGWLTYSERLMTVMEVQHALAIEPETPDLDEDNLSDIGEIVGFCAGLVIIDEETQIIRLVHYTTQDYFRQNGDRLLASAQQDIAISCLTYLLYDRFGDGWIVEADSEEEPESEEEPDHEEVGSDVPITAGNRLQKYPFLDYAARYSAIHTSRCGQRTVKELMIHFAKDDRKVASASQVMLVVDAVRDDFYELINMVRNSIQITKSPCPLSALHFLAYQGYEDLIAELLDHGFEADAKDSSQNTPLWWAARQGQHAVVELLLSQSHVNVNSRGLKYDIYVGHYSATSPLGVAANMGKDGVVKLLIAREDLDVNLSDEHGISPLSSAARGGYSTIVKLLLARSDINVNSRDFEGVTPLSCAAFWGHEDIVRQLIKRKDIQVNAVDRAGISPLAKAADRCHEDVVKILLGHADIDVNTRDRYGRTPLVHAVHHKRNEAVVKLLLSRTDIKVNYKDNGGQTVLHHAATWFFSSPTVKLLTSRTDIDVNVKDVHGYTPLYAAVVSRSKSSVGILLEHADIEINTKTNGGYTPLAQAMIIGSAEIVELLCAHPDVALNSTDDKGRDVFALVSGKQEFISNSATYEEEDKVRIISDLEECLQILRTAISKRSREQS